MTYKYVCALKKIKVILHKELRSILYNRKELKTNELTDAKNDTLKTIHNAMVNIYTYFWIHRIIASTIEKPLCINHVNIFTLGAL